MVSRVSQKKFELLTYPSSKDPGGKFWFQLQISNIWAPIEISEERTELWGIDVGQFQFPLSNTFSSAVINFGPIQERSTYKHKKRSLEIIFLEPD